MSTANALSVELTAPNGHQYRQPLGLFIDNEWVEACSGEKITSIDPATESEIATVHAAGAADVDRAVAAARRAFQGPWRQLDGTSRGALLAKLADLIGANRHTLATIETWDNGKPFKVAYEEDLAEVIAVCRYYAGYADKNPGGQVVETDASQLVYTVAEPVGVCGQIIPWNYPLSMASWKFAPALAAGNTVVLKAAEQTPLSILFLADLFAAAGFPAGVVNIVNGYGRSAGAALAGHGGVDKIAFTGSTATGREIMRAAAGNLKNITLETGGKSPLVVFADADLEEAVHWAHLGVMGNAGQMCTANSRILVHEAVHDEFVALFKARVEAASSKVGDPFRDDTFQGPQVTRAQMERVLAYVEAGKRDGATLAVGGGRAGGGRGFYVQPTVFTSVQPWMRIYRDEVFGPFAVVASFRTEDEAVEAANDTDYGLGAAIFTRDLARAHRVAKRVQSGTVWINSSNNSDYRVPFGGYKSSGIGRECGAAGLAAYVVHKSVFVALGSKL